MKIFLVVSYDGYVGVENHEYTEEQLLSEEQSWRHQSVRDFVHIAEVGAYMAYPDDRKGESASTTIRIR